MKKQTETQLKATDDYFRDNLPFFLNEDFSSCNAHKLYKWQTEFLLNRNTLAFLTAANQIGKSTVHILRAINQATRMDLWPYWFPKKRPTTMIYCYPDAKLGTTEFEEKWEKIYLPKDRMKNDARYGWRSYYDARGFIESIVFNSGVTIYFRYYSQKPSTLQAHSIDAVFLDEECPEEHYDELMVRTQSTQAMGSGFVSMVFTATLCQQYLYHTMECQGLESELFKDAWKRQISVFDCMTHTDGTPSEIWTDDYINNKLIPRYRNQREINRRIMGRFVKDSALLHQEFDAVSNTEVAGATNMDGWKTYVGIDFGTGGENGHSSSIAVCKVDPTYTQVRVIRVWYSKRKRMTQSDLLLRYKDIASELGTHWCFADSAATDFFTLAAREGIRIEMAEKSHEIGINLLNNLFKSKQLKIVHPLYHSSHLILELQTIGCDTKKNKRIDDAADALRYCLAKVPLRITELSIEKKMEEDLKGVNPRTLFYRGLDRRDDPMLGRDDDDIYFEPEFSKEIQDAIDEFEELL
jgi:hypothetical protein